MRYFIALIIGSFLYCMRGIIRAQYWDLNEIQLRREQAQIGWMLNIVAVSALFIVGVIFADDYKNRRKN